LLIERSISIIQLLDAIWTQCHEQCIIRVEQARKWVINKYKWTPWAEDLITAWHNAASKCRVIGNIQKFVDKEKRILQIEAKVQGPDFFEPRGKLYIQPEN
jgi:hypothetical protein